MACEAPTLVAASSCLAECMSTRQLLASIACSLATQLGMSCTPSTLIAASNCLAECMSDHQLLASIACSMAEVSGGEATAIYDGVGDPNAAGLVPANAAQPAYYNEYSALGVPVETWWWDTTLQTWV